MNPYTLLITCTIAVVMWFALEKAGMKKWPAFAVMWALLMGAAALAQFVVWPGRY